MINLHTLTRVVVTLSCVATFALAAGCSKSIDTGTAGAGSLAISQTAAAPHVKVTSKLGDLSAFRNITADVSSLAEKGDFPSAKTRIKDLEVTWDSAEAGLKPRAADDWHTIDRLIDHALRTVRAEPPSPPDCKKAMAELLVAFDSLQGKL